MGILEEIGAARSRQDLAALWDRYYPEGLWTGGLTQSAEVRLRELQAPRCRMCARSARWLVTRLEYAPYCAGMSCSNKERVCQRQGCEEPFTLGLNGAGTKYCSTECKALAYRAGKGIGALCAWCRKPSENTHRGSVSGWPYICAECLGPIRHLVDRLKAHHVSHERARLLIDDPICEVETCGIDIVVKIDTGHGKRKSLLVVDHDHGCCPGDTHSCGRCVRGLICGGCNSAAGLLRDSPSLARGLADYLDRSVVTRRENHGA